LSAAAGALDISSTTDEGDVTIVWAETGGPEISEAPVMGGFGSKLLARSFSDQLGGEISYDWQPTGLVAALRLRKDRLAA
jgi:two-component sensor histidine kinase